MEEFEAKIGLDGRAYIPVKKADKLDVSDGDIVKIVSDELTEYSKVSVRRRDSRVEYKVHFNSSYSGSKMSFEVSKLSVPDLECNGFKEILGNFDCGVDKDKVVLLGRKSRVFLNKENLKLDNFTHYLGAFYADGLKESYSWGISASTFKQANYYMRKHRELVDNPEVKKRLTYTHHDNERDEELLKQWKDNTGLDMDAVDRNKSEVKESSNRNEYGSVYFRTHKTVLGRLYNKMLEKTIEKILNDELSAWCFILGMQEGDGTPPSKKQGHIEQTVEDKKIGEVKKIFRKAGIKTKPCKRKDGNYKINIGSLDILSNFHKIEPMIFKYYPERKKKLMSRLLDTGAAKFILGTGKSYLTGDTHRKMRKANVINENQELTEEGEKIKKSLESVTVK